MAILVALGVGAAGAQAPSATISQAPVRDAAGRVPAEAKGTGIIRGRVLAADTGSPIRHARVSLIPVPAAAPPVAGAAASPSRPVIVTLPGPLRSQSTTTDAQGVFEFKELPPGSYRINASPGQFAGGYIGLAYGAKQPMGAPTFEAGTPIPLAAGQTFDQATIRLPRGAVITGRVLDENGEPLARVQVYTVLFTPGSSRGSRTGGATTDDLGQFRVYALSPGEYAVGAEARSSIFVAPNAPPETEEDKNGYLTTFFPGTGDEASAQRVRTKAGTETGGIDIHMLSGRLARVTGTVLNSEGRPVARASGTLFRRAGTTTFGMGGFSTDAAGHFEMRNVAPGLYRLTVRQLPQGPRNPDGSPMEQGESASVPLNVVTDMEGVLVSTAPGATVTGNVVFDAAPPAQERGPAIRVSAVNGDPDNMTGLPVPQPAVVGPDLTFTLKGLTGEMLLRASAPGNTLKQVLLGSDDITDAPREFRNGDRVTIVLTSRASTVEGTVTDESGKPATEGSLVMFSDDKASWRTNSVRTRRANIDPNGHFRIPSVLAGRYFIVAVPRIRIAEVLPGADSSAFEALAKDATIVVVGEDEQRQVDLRLVTGGGGA